MITRTIAITIFAITATAAVFVGRRQDSKVPSYDELLGHVMRTKTGRATSILFWVWVGWHFFCR